MYIYCTRAIRINFLLLNVGTTESPARDLTSKGARTQYHLTNSINLVFLLQHNLAYGTPTGG